MNNGSLFIANSYGLSGSTLSNTVPGAVVFTNNITSAYLGGLAGGVDLGLTNTFGTGVALVVGGNNSSSTYTGVLSGLGGSLTKVGSGALTLSGINTYSGDTTVNGGTLVAGMLTNGLGRSGSSLGTSTNLIVSGGTVRFGVTAQLVVTNLVTGSVSLNGGTLDAASLVNLGRLTVGSTGTNTITTGLLNQNPGSVGLSGSTLVVGPGGHGWVTNSGTISGYGTLASSAVNNSGLVSASVSNQLLAITGAATGAGTYRAAAGATLSFNGGGTVSSLFNTNGTIRVAGGVLTNTSAFDNYAGALALAGGAYQTGLQFTNTGWLGGYGSVTASNVLVNRGVILANGGTSPLIINTNLVNNSDGLVQAVAGSLQVTGVFTNNGTLQFISSVGTYSRAVVDNGAWDTSGYGGSSVFLNNFIITTNGYISAANNNQYVFKADLFNSSTNSLAWETLGVPVGSNTADFGGTRFLFSGTGVGQTQTFATVGLRLTGGFDGDPANPTSGVQQTVGYAAGFSNNFAVGQLFLTNTTLVLEQAVPNASLTNALFLNDLYLFGSSRLIISNDMAVYFVNSNDWTLANITLLGNAQIHQLTGIYAVIPEPNVLLMWLCGGLTVWAARRRRHSRKHLQN